MFSKGLEIYPVTVINWYSYMYSMVFKITNNVKKNLLIKIIEDLGGKNKASLNKKCTLKIYTIVRFRQPKLPQPIQPSFPTPPSNFPGPPSSFPLPPSTYSTLPSSFSTPPSNFPAPPSSFSTAPSGFKNQTVEYTPEGYTILAHHPPSSPTYAQLPPAPSPYIHRGPPPTQQLNLSRGSKI